VRRVTNLCVVQTCGSRLRERYSTIWLGAHDGSPAPSRRRSMAATRRCPKHGMKLWTKAKVRQIRFHALCHTTGSLLMMAGANPAAVQRILRSDPRITTEVYGHLAPGYLRAEIDRLQFRPPGTRRTSG